MKFGHGKLVAMEQTPKEEQGNQKRESLVERKRQAAFTEITRELNDRLTHDIGKTFEVHGREYELTSVEDCMVAYAQKMRAEVRALHAEVRERDDYYEEKAVAKLLELFRAYERLVALYAELRSYYPVAGAQVSEHIPSLSRTTEHAEALWKKVQGNA